MSALRSFLSSLLRKLKAPVLTILLVVLLALVLWAGIKRSAIGGLIGRLLGKKTTDTQVVEVANTPPPGRVDPSGKVLPPGTPDAKGDTQAVVVPIQSPGVFSNPTTVTFTPPGSSAVVEVQLPTGVKNSDVDKVLVVDTKVVGVTVKDTSGITTQTVDDLLAKYGSK